MSVILFDLSYFCKFGFTYTKSKYNLYTVLKSPHIDKRSREQFHLVHFKTILHYPNFLCASLLALGYLYSDVFVRKECSFLHTYKILII